LRASIPHRSRRRSCRARAIARQLGLCPDRRGALTSLGGAEHRRAGTRRRLGLQSTIAPAAADAVGERRHGRVAHVLRGADASRLASASTCSQIASVKRIVV
jgi:hypothetical protein